MISINALSVLFRAAADQHPMVNQYGIGQVYNISADAATTYPLLWVVPDGGDMGEEVYTHRFTMYLIDRMKEDFSNEVEVLSDTHQVLTDVLTVMYDWSHDKEYTMQWGGTFSPIVDEQADIVAGHSVQVSFEVFHGKDSCAIPGVYIEPDVLTTDEGDYLLWT